MKRESIPSNSPLKEILGNCNIKQYFYPIVLAGTSSTMLNKRGGSGHPCLVPDLREKAFKFSL